MNKKQKLVAKKHRRNKERLKALKQASILAGSSKLDKSDPKKTVGTKKTVTKAKPTTKKSTAKKKPAAKKSTKKSTTKNAKA